MQPFKFEFALFTLLANLVEAAQGALDRFNWEMKPSRGYLLISEMVGWFRDRAIWHFDQPAFLYVMEQCQARAEALEGTSDDEKRAMFMTTWRDREPPVPGGQLSILQIFDWFMPMLRRMESNVMRYWGNPDTMPNGKEFTEYEAWNIVFGAVDWLSKDPHFGRYNNWGQPEPYSWVQFIRDEMYLWDQQLKPRAPKPPAGYEPPFSSP